MKNLEKKLRELKLFGVVGIKQSLEDEGSSFSEIRLLRKLTKKLNLKFNVKIGGCEAKNDIYFCKSIKTDSIVAPMVESEYAIEKFMLCANIDKKNKLLINLETINALNNLDKMLNSVFFKYLDGVVIGRSDIVGSLGLSKDDVNSKKIFDKVKSTLLKIKKKSRKKMIFKMGGSITTKAKSFIKRLYDLKLLDYIETRNIEIKLSEKNLNNLNILITKSFEFETLWLEYKIKQNKPLKNLKYSEDKKREREIRKRLNKQK